MSDRSDRHLRKMYDRDVVRWRQGRGPMPILSDYVGKPKSEGCLVAMAKLIGVAILGTIGCVLLWFFAGYFLLRMITG